jgi:hypothetical protein
MAPLPHDGVRLRLGGRELVVPALNFRQLKALAPRFAALRRRGPELGLEQIDALVEIAHAALARNYPDLAREEVAELIDMRNAREVVEAVIGAAGLVRLDAPGAARAGEPAPGAPSLGESHLGEMGAASRSSGSTGTA